MKLTRKQVESVFNTWNRSNNDMTYLQFRRSVQSGYDCIMVQWCGMWLGIEKDGHTHS